MQSKPIWDYILIGTCIRYLQDAQVGQLIHGDGYMISNIEHFLNELEKLGLHVTKRASSDLVDIKNKLKARKEGSTLTTADAGELGKIVTQIRHTFTAETEGIYGYFVTDKRHDVNKLLGRVDLLLKPGVFESLPEISKYDFKEAGICIAFERSTAAAFHILRGTEAVLKLFYKRYFRKSKENKTWGEMTNELKNKNRGKKPNTVIINHLDNIRLSFRNPTQHPEKIYDIQEVQDLFGVCIEVVDRMMS